MTSNQNEKPRAATLGKKPDLINDHKTQFPASDCKSSLKTNQSKIAGFVRAKSYCGEVSL
jgi:hypothetical protein